MSRIQSGPSADGRQRPSDARRRPCGGNRGERAPVRSGTFRLAVEGRRPVVREQRGRDPTGIFSTAAAGTRAGAGRERLSARRCPAGARRAARRRGADDLGIRCSGGSVSLVLDRLLSGLDDGEGRELAPRARPRRIIPTPDAVVAPQPLHARREIAQRPPRRSLQALRRSPSSHWYRVPTAASARSVGRPVAIAAHSAGKLTPAPSASAIDP